MVKLLPKFINLQKLCMDFPKHFIFGDGFGKLTKLETICSDHSRALTKDMFQVFANSNVSELRMNGGIRHIDKRSFLPLRRLSILDLSNNADLGLVTALKSLYGLQKHSTKMEEIKFSGLTKRHDKRLGQPSTFNVHRNQTIYLRNICVRSIDLSSNSIMFWQPFSGLSDCLEILKLQSNCLYQPGEVLFELMRHPFIKHADISDNIHIKKIQRRPSLDSSIDLSSSSNFSDSLLTLNISQYRTTHGFYHYCLIGYFHNLRSLDASHTYFYFPGQMCVSHVNVSWLPKAESHRHPLRRLQRLSLRYNPNIHAIIGDSRTTTNFLNYMSDLQEIDLSANKLTRLDRNIFINNTNLSSISLANNKLQGVPLAITQLMKISWLDLSGNAITHLNAEEMARLDHFSAPQPRVRFKFSSNSFQCTCATLDSIRWIYKNKRFLDLAGNYTCVLANGSLVDLSSFESKISNFSVSCVSRTWLIVAIVGLLVVSLLCSQCYIVYRYRTNLRYWLYTKLTPPVEMFVQRKYVYDAFVAYVEENYSWIYNDVRDVLENRADPLKLCFHNRDFTPGKPIHENIVDKMRESRKIILAVSRHFLNSTYGPLEIEYAGMKSLQEGREDLIICILLEEIPVREMPKPLRNLWHKITFLKWPEDPREQPHFWKQLRDAITDVRV